MNFQLWTAEYGSIMHSASPKATVDEPCQNVKPEVRSHPLVSGLGYAMEVCRAQKHKSRSKTWFLTGISAGIHQISITEIPLNF